MASSLLFGTLVLYVSILAVVLLSALRSLQVYLRERDRAARDLFLALISLSAAAGAAGVYEVSETLGLGMSDEAEVVLVVALIASKSFFLIFSFNAREGLYPPEWPGRGGGEKRHIDESIIHPACRIP